MSTTHMPASNNKTTILKEYPRPYDPAAECEPYYPINNPENNGIHQRYVKNLEDFPNVILCGRLAEYKYYNMDAVIERALACAEKAKAETA
ncbi:MAG: hypothetical protein LBG65_08515 [Puniceicoccales bacterium]|jgi:UDP-galactopyranose mutase|nr:hypothetical protein [Puniceicoccales bacterium]